jgi:hypothetical protein
MIFNFMTIFNSVQSGLSKVVLTYLCLFSYGHIIYKGSLLGAL